MALPDPTALAATLGAQALPLFALLLALLLLGVAAGWWGVHRHVLPRARAGLAPNALVLLGAGLGFCIVLTLAWGFAEIAEQLGPDGRMARADTAFSTALGAQVSDTTLRAFAVLTHLGDVIVLTLLGMAVGLWLLLTRRYTLALGWVLALAGNALLNPLLKHIFERVRPEHDHGFVSASGFSFPSGHTSGATVAYGMLAYVLVRSLPRAWQLPALLATAALAFTVGCSRIFLQVHYVSDVLAGFASGGAWLWVCILSAELGRSRGRAIRTR